jgi:hypothetical protein
MTKLTLDLKIWIGTITMTAILAGIAIWAVTHGP